MWTSHGSQGGSRTPSEDDFFIESGSQDKTLRFTNGVPRDKSTDLLLDYKISDSFQSLDREEGSRTDSSGITLLRARQETFMVGIKQKEYIHTRKYTIFM